MASRLLSGSCSLSLIQKPTGHLSAKAYAMKLRGRNPAWSKSIK